MLLVEIGDRFCRKVQGVGRELIDDVCFRVPIRHQPEDFGKVPHSRISRPSVTPGRLRPRRLLPGVTMALLLRRETKNTPSSHSLLRGWVFRPLQKQPNFLSDSTPTAICPPLFPVGGIAQAQSGLDQGLLKAKLTMRKAYGFKTLKCLEIALYHTLGELPEPEYHHRFC